MSVFTRYWRTERFYFPNNRGVSGIGPLSSIVKVMSLLLYIGKPNVCLKAKLSPLLGDSILLYFEQIQARSWTKYSYLGRGLLF